MPQDARSTDPRCPLDADRLQRVALEQLIDLHPTQMSLDELVHELTDTPDDFASHDRIEITVQQLVRSGLMHRHGAFVVQTFGRRWGSRALTSG